MRQVDSGGCEGDGSDDDDNDENDDDDRSSLMMAVGVSY